MKIVPGHAETETFRIRHLRTVDLGAVAELYQAVMFDQFLASCGSRFLRSYCRAWMRSPSGIALAAESLSDGAVVGLLLGSLFPGVHYRAMVRRGGGVIAVALILRAVERPGWGIWVARTRGSRYLTGLRRMIGRDPADGDAHFQSRVGEVTHLLVAAQWRGRGVGRALVEHACQHAIVAKLDLLTAVTPPGWASERFYAHLGWTSCGQVISRSNERFVRYEFAPNLNAPTETVACLE